MRLADRGGGGIAQTYQRICLTGKVKISGEGTAPESKDALGQHISAGAEESSGSAELGEQPIPSYERQSIAGRSLFRTILTADAVIIGTVLGAALVWKVRHVLLLVAIGVFIAIVLEPAVRFLRRRGVSRGTAVAIVLVIGIVVFGALGYLFVPPVVKAGTHFAQTLPSLINKAENGKGWLGQFSRAHHWGKYVKQISSKLQNYFSSFSLYSSVGQGAISVARSTVGVLVDSLIVAVFALFTLLEAPRIANGILALLSPETEARTRRIVDEAFRSVTGYVLGKLFTSALFGLVIFAVLTATGTSYGLVLALWVGLIDLLPLIGGLLAALVVVPVALAHSVGAAIATLIVFLIYQQLENHVLGPVIMRKTMQLNPLLTLFSVLLGANLLGIVGALIAIPIAGVIQVLAKEAWVSRRDRITRWTGRRTPAPIIAQK